MSIAIIERFAHGLRVRAGGRDRRRRADQYAQSRELALLAEARTVEREARTLLTEAGEALALDDSHALIDTKQIGCGKGIPAVRMALSHARWAQRELKWGDDFIGASIRMNIAKAALASAEEKAELGKVMVAEMNEEPDPYSPHQRIHADQSRTA